MQLYIVIYLPYVVISYHSLVLAASLGQVLTEHVDAPPCRPHQVGFWEDVNVAFCLAAVSA